MAIDQGNHKIHLAGNFRLIEQPALTGAAISPGMLIETVNNSGKLAFQKHSTAGGAGEPVFAMEDALQGNTVTTAYADGDPVQAGDFTTGCLILALLKAGTNYTIGTKLQSNGDGTLTTRSGTNTVIAVVTVPCNLSASGTVNTLSQVRITHS